MYQKHYLLEIKKYLVTQSIPFLKITKTNM